MRLYDDKKRKIVDGGGVEVFCFIFNFVSFSRDKEIDTDRHGQRKGIDRKEETNRCRLGID